MIRIILGILLLVIVGCNNVESDQFALRDGDILFRGHTSDSLSLAINEVTRIDESTNFSHMGVVEVEKDQVYVIHASSEKGVVREVLEEFQANKNEENLEVVAYRVNDEHHVNTDAVLEEAHYLIGEPYNFTYILEDTGYYCSEFVYAIFDDYKIFELNPMTFKSGDSDDFPRAWVDHYKKLGIAIPEGLPGCNPNGMAKTDKLQLLGIVE